MTKQPTIDVHTERSTRTGDDSAWLRYRWLCSACGHTAVADRSPDARAEGDQHITDTHRRP